MPPKSTEKTPLVPKPPKPTSEVRGLMKEIKGLQSTVGKLEKTNGKLTAKQDAKKDRPKRALSQYNLFVQEQTKGGKSFKDATSAWKEHKGSKEE